MQNFEIKCLSKTIIVILFLTMTTEKSRKKLAKLH